MLYLHYIIPCPLHERPKDEIIFLSFAQCNYIYAVFRKLFNLKYFTHKNLQTNIFVLVTVAKIFYCRIIIMLLNKFCMHAYESLELSLKRCSGKWRVVSMATTTTIKRYGNHLPASYKHYMIWLNILVVWLPLLASAGGLWQRAHDFLVH